MSLRPPSGSGDAAQHLVSDFARAEIAGQPFDVASSDRHTVKPWLANRTTVSGTIVDLAPEGFPLVGGRVTIVDRVPTPTLVYRHNEHVVAVTELPIDAKGPRGTGAIETIDGYHVARWADANLDLCRRLRHGRKGARRFRRGVPAGRRRCDRTGPPLSRSKPLVEPTAGRGRPGARVSRHAPIRRVRLCRPEARHFRAKRKSMLSVFLFGHPQRRFDWRRESWPQAQRNPSSIPSDLKML